MVIKGVHTMGDKKTQVYLKNFLNKKSISSKNFPNGVSMGPQRLNLKLQKNVCINFHFYM